MKKIGIHYMNIFVLSENVNEIAMYQIDKHCIKMPLESALMLSTAHRVIDGKETTVLSKSGRKIKKYILNDEREDMLYGSSHINHPSTVWTRTNKQNYLWHFDLFLAMLKEYTYRYGKIHACEKLIPFLQNSPKNIPDGEFFLPTPAMPTPLKIVAENPVPGRKYDVIKSYHNYYNKEKSRFATWHGKINSRPTPEWYQGV
jgi:hypothetical protein